MAPTVMLWTGAALCLASLWPMWAALESVTERDFVAALVQLGLVWLLSRTGLELASSADGTGLGDGR